MEHPYRHVDVERRGEVLCVRLRRPRLEEAEIHELADECLALVRDGCRRMVLSLGPKSPECLYSVFLGKLLTLQRALREQGGELKLCDVSPHVLGIFEACQLQDYFEFHRDPAAAVRAFGD